VVIEKRRGIARMLHALLNSSRGLAYVWKNEAAFRQELMLFVFLTPLAFLISERASDVVLLLLSLWLVLIVEVINTSIEVVVNRIGFEPHELSGVAKDVGSAAVMLSLLVAFLVWSVFVFAYLQQLFAW